MSNDVEEEDDTELSEKELEKVAVLYDQIRSVRRRIEKNMDKKLAEDFDKRLKIVMAFLS